MTEPTYMQEQAYARLDVIQEKAESIISYVARCRKLVGRGLAADVDGMRTYEVAAQYGELMAIQANLLKVQADTMVTKLRSLEA